MEYHDLSGGYRREEMKMIVADGLIFDLDGTLWDSRRAVLDIWNETISKHGIPMKVTMKKLTGCMGLTLREISRELFPDISEEEGLAVIDACGANETAVLSKQGGELFPQLEDTLAYLAQKYKLMIVSNCQAGYIEAFFAAHKLEAYFIDYENPARTGLDKAGNISLVVERNGLKNPVYIGDIQKDCDAATKAGVPFVHAAYGFGTAAGPAVVGVLQQFSDLKKMF